MVRAHCAARGAADAATGVVRLDLWHLIEHTERVMRETFAWRAWPPRPIPELRPCLPPGGPWTMPIEDVVGEPPRSLALSRGEGQPSDVLQLLTSNDDVKAFIHGLASQGCWAGQKSIPIITANMRADDIVKMGDAGILQVNEDEFFEMHVSLRPEAIWWRAGLGLDLPWPVVRMRTQTFNVLHCSKLEMVMHLRQQGWVAAPRAGLELPPINATSENVYKARWGLAQSYFAALVAKPMILAKVEECHHDGQGPLLSVLDLYERRDLTALTARLERGQERRLLQAEAQSR